MAGAHSPPYNHSAPYRSKVKKIFVFLVFAVLLVAGCSSKADTASYNLSKSADNFEVDRRIVFINGITDKYLLVIEGKCSLGNYDDPGELTVTCKTGPESYKKHFLGLSDNVTYVAEQLDDVPVNVYRYKAIFRPETLLPDIEMDTQDQPGK